MSRSTKVFCNLDDPFDHLAFHEVERFCQGSREVTYNWFQVILVPRTVILARDMRTFHELRNTKFSTIETILVPPPA